MSEEPENVKKWLESADKAIVQLEGKETWDEVHLSTSTVKIIPGTWIFRRKRSPDGTITKWKARWVLRGYLQDVNFDTYASVVARSTVRMFMVLELILSWTIKVLDFDNAFVQAAVDHEVFAFLPLDYSMIKTYIGDKACLKLRKSLYGLS
jgi:hypothetical protein